MLKGFSEEFYFLACIVLIPKQTSKSVPAVRWLDARMGHIRHNRVRREIMVVMTQGLNPVKSNFQCLKEVRDEQCSSMCSVLGSLDEIQ